MSSSLVGEHSKTSLTLLCKLSFARFMGGGPRTFPGGINKWQWKRLHEKKAREKERKLLEQEKQLYQARVRSQIRAKLAGKKDVGSSDTETSSNYSAMTAKDHVKALADRFMKEGAEDLWNENDGPLKSPPRPRTENRKLDPPIDLRRLISDRRNLGENRASWNPVMDSSKPRHYSVEAGGRIRRKSRFRMADSSSGDDDSEFSFPVTTTKCLGFVSNEGESSDEGLHMEGRTSEKIMSRGALGNHDVKKMRRDPRFAEQARVAQEIQFIKDELNRRKSSEIEIKQDEEESHLTQKRFDECSISPLTVRALSSAGYLQMTIVQEATLSICLEGKDALVKAKCGTGKSAAFLLPAIEAALKAKNSNTPQRSTKFPPIFVLILCPTREIASQIAAEANVMLKYHDGIGVQALIGGTRFKDDQKRLESNTCQIIVATPGRLLDHIEHNSGFSARLMGLKMLVLDEADHLLDLGFRKDVENIVDCVPRQRQSLLFSATIPKEVRRISQLVLKREHSFIDTVGLQGVETHDKVKQSLLVAPHDLHFQIVHHLLKEHISGVVDYKVIVFCTTAMVASLTFLLLREMKMNVREMHSRKPQLYRARISDEFRESKRLILITSDVSSRGVNYPDVTLVIQVGIPSDREQYIHRLGRTGREGKEGEGILLLAPWEEYFLDAIKDLPIEKSTLPQLDSDVEQKMEASMAQIDTSIKEAAYHAWLGYYNSITEIGRDKTVLVEMANRFSNSIGLQKPPALFRKTALKMGLKEIPGIRIRK